jgi:hypothetical protein
VLLFAPHKHKVLAFLSCRHLLKIWARMNAHSGTSGAGTVRVYKVTDERDNVRASVCTDLLSVRQQHGSNKGNDGDTVCV